MLDEQFIIFHENLFLTKGARIIAPKVLFDWSSIGFLKDMLAIQKIRDINFVVLCEKYGIILRKVFDKYMISIDIIDSEDEAKNIARLHPKSFYFKLRESKEEFLSLNPYMVGSLEDARHYIFNHLI